MKYPRIELEAIRSYFTNDKAVAIKRIFKQENGTSCYYVTLASGCGTEIYVINKSGNLLVFENIY